MVSSEMPELLGVCDRIIVMSGGQVAGEVDAKNTSQEEILTPVSYTHLSENTFPPHFPPLKGTNRH